MDFTDEIEVEFELEDIQETDIVRDELDLSTNTRFDLMERTKEKDYLSFGSKHGASR